MTDPIEELINTVKEERTKNKRKRKRNRKKKKPTIITDTSAVQNQNNIQDIPVNQIKRGKNKFLSDPSRNAGKKYIKEDKQKAQEASSKGHRQPQQKININCDTCNRSFNVFANQTRSVFGTNEIMYTCPKCLSKGSSK